MIKAIFTVPPPTALSQQGFAVRAVSLMYVVAPTANLARQRTFLEKDLQLGSLSTVFG